MFVHCGDGHLQPIVSDSSVVIASGGVVAADADGQASVGLQPIVADSSVVIASSDVVAAGADGQAPVCHRLLALPGPLGLGDARRLAH